MGHLTVAPISSLPHPSEASGWLLWLLTSLVAGQTPPIPCKINAVFEAEQRNHGARKTDNEQKPMIKYKRD